MAVLTGICASAAVAFNFSSARRRFSVVSPWSSEIPFSAISCCKQMKQN